MKVVFTLVIIVACSLLIAAMIFIDNGIVRDSMICALGALSGFLLAYQMQARFGTLSE